MNTPDRTHRPEKPPFSVFVALTVFLFFCALSAADSIGFVPYYVDGTESPRKIAMELEALAEQEPAIPTPTPRQPSFPAPRAQAPQAAPVASTILPKHIAIPAAGIDLPIQNPTTRDIDTLDTLLQSGPARYVDSAALGSAGNILIFAHSSHLPVVHNQMYKAFNNIPYLTEGDTITLTGSDGRKYLYSVDSVRTANANDEIIDLRPSVGTKLTLVTCDTLTSKSSRFVLTATFISILP